MYEQGIVVCGNQLIVQAKFLWVFGKLICEQVMVVKSQGNQCRRRGVGGKAGCMSENFIVTVSDNWAELQRLIFMDPLVKSNRVACEGDLGRMLRYVQFMVELKDLDSEGVTRCARFDNILERVVLGAEQAIRKLMSCSVDGSN